MKYFFVSTILFMSLHAFPQDCSKELLAKKPGTWKAGQQGQIFKVTKGDLVREKAIITSIHKMIASQYKPIGCQVLYSTVYGGNYPTPEQPWIADTYHYAMYILRYLCDQQSTDKSKYYVDIATPTTVNITANAMFWLSSLYAANLAPDDFRGYLKLTKRPVKKDGYYFMGEEQAGCNINIIFRFVSTLLVAQIPEYIHCVMVGVCYPGLFGSVIVASINSTITYLTSNGFVVRCNHFVDAGYYCFFFY